MYTTRLYYVFTSVFGCRAKHIHRLTTDSMCLLNSLLMFLAPWLFFSNPHLTLPSYKLIFWGSCRVYCPTMGTLTPYITCQLKHQQLYKEHLCDSIKGPLICNFLQSRIPDLWSTMGRKPEIDPFFRHQ